MPAPGSSHALVLPTSSEITGDIADAGKRLTTQLTPFLDATKYTAVAVVHGLGTSAPNAFDLAKLRRPAKGGIVWVTDAEFLPHLSGTDAATLRRLLKASPGHVLSFFSVNGARVTGHLHWSQLEPFEVDLKFVNAAQNQKD